MPRSLVTLYSAATGESTKVDAGEGLRQKDWQHEFSRWLMEAVESLTLKGLSLDGHQANYPAYLTGEGIDGFDGVSFFKVTRNTAVIMQGDGSETDTGGEALTENDRTHANYFNTSTDPDDPPAPAGASAPAFLQTLADGGGFALNATSGILTFRVNGTLYTITGLTGSTTLAEDIRDAITDAGVPVDVQVEGSDTLRIFAPGNGVTSNIEAVAVSGDVASVLFTGASQSSQPNVLYTGTNGPLGVMSNVEVQGSHKPQRRILPGSVVVTATIGSSTVTVTDDKNGVLADSTNTHTGTIDYATGAIDIDWGTAPDNSTNVSASWKALQVLNPEDPVRHPTGNTEIAILLN